MKYTSNLNLKMPELTDNVLVSDINENMDTIDAKCKALDEKIDNKSEGVLPQILATTEAGATVHVSGEGQSYEAVATDRTATIDVKTYGTYEVYATLDGETTGTMAVEVTEVKRYAVSVLFTQIYGVEWDKSSTTKFARTDNAALFVDPVAALGTGRGSSPFDDIYPWSGMEKVTMNGDVLVKIPKYYVRIENGAKFKIQITDKPTDGFRVSPAHADRGDGKGERDYIYVSRYTLNSNYKSTSGNQSVVNMTRATARSNIKNRGTGYYQYDYHTYLTILYLYLVEYADWNSQTAVGYGYVSGNSAQTNTGGTDSMTYHTGTPGNSRGANSPVQYRWIENLWGNLYQFIDGIYFSGTSVYIIDNPNNFTDTANGRLLSFTRANESGWTTGFGSDNSTPEFIYPNAVGGSETTHITDYSYYNASGVVLYAGGGWGNAGRAGLCCLIGDYAVTGSVTSISARLIYLP